MENINEQIQQIEERVGKAWQEIVAMEERLGELPDKVEEFNSSLQNLGQTVASTKDQIVNISTHYSDYYAKTDPSIKTKLETVIEHHATIEQFQKASTAIKKELEDFKEFIYGNESVGKLGFKKEIESLYENDKNANETLNKNWEESYQALFAKIEGLLPGATATGLSKAYQDQKENYKWPVVLWSIVFGVTVLGMMIFGIAVYKEAEIKDIQATLHHILARLPFFIPAVWLAIFASKQQSQYKRLQQEYIYKETLAKSYEAYKREIDLLPEGAEKVELQQKLISSLVEMCGYNPSLTLEHKSHDEKPPIPGEGIFKRFTKSKISDEKTEA